MASYPASYIETLQKEHEAKFWKVFDSSGKVLINTQIKDISLDDSIELLQDCLEKCLGDYVIVKLYTKKPERREPGTTNETGLSIRVKLAAGNNTHTREHSISGAPTWRDMIESQKELSELQMEKLRMELEGKEQSPWSRIAEKLLENDGLILGITSLLSKVGKGAAIAEQPPQNLPSNIQETIQRLSKVDSDYENTLAKMVAYLEKNPGVINQIKPIFEQ